MKLLYSTFWIFMFATATARMSERTCDRDFSKCTSNILRDCFFESESRDDFQKCTCSKYDILKEWYLFIYVRE